ncbi:hypothetical protein FPOA_02059 [Fusarium poae]|uniref:Uncharacterized protein n=1 Tax=Fusarium poae TaxID=36050 RepID=A0A1B8B5X4_FUSPO|nr:hypothetical protein FPOA_02059 [Fusarium poae]
MSPSDSPMPMFHWNPVVDYDEWLEFEPNLHREDEGEMATTSDSEIWQEPPATVYPLRTWEERAAAAVATVKRKLKELEEMEEEEEEKKKNKKKAMSPDASPAAAAPKERAGVVRAAVKKKMKEMMKKMKEMMTKFMFELKLKLKLSQKDVLFQEKF